MTCSQTRTVIQLPIWRTLQSHLLCGGARKRPHLLRGLQPIEGISNGAVPKDVQEFLGHADVSTTMNIYVHATREAKRTSARLLDKVVGGEQKLALVSAGKGKNKGKYIRFEHLIGDTP